MRGKEKREEASARSAAAGEHDAGSSGPLTNKEGLRKRRGRRAGPNGGHGPTCHRDESRAEPRREGGGIDPNPTARAGGEPGGFSGGMLLAGGSPGRWEFGEDGRNERGGRRCLKGEGGRGRRGVAAAWGWGGEAGLVLESGHLGLGAKRRGRAWEAGAALWRPAWPGESGRGRGAFEPRSARWGPAGEPPFGDPKEGDGPVRPWAAAAARRRRRMGGAPPKEKEEKGRKEKKKGKSFPGKFKKLHFSDF